MFPSYLGITDHSQHLDVVVARSSAILQGHTTPGQKLIQGPQNTRLYKGGSDVIFTEDIYREQDFPASVAVDGHKQVSNDKMIVHSSSSLRSFAQENLSTQSVTPRPLTIPDEYTHMFGSGTLAQSFGMRSVYRNYPGSENEVTTNQNGWVVVDYLLDSTNFSSKYNKFVEGNLK